MRADRDASLLSALPQSRFVRRMNREGGEQNGADFGEERLKNLHQNFGAKCLTFILTEYSW